jgi:uncharacterized membrane protein
VTERPRFRLRLPPRLRAVLQAPSAMAARASLLLGTIAGSLVLFVQDLVGGKLADFVKANTLPFPVRMHLLYAVAGAFAVAAIGGLAYARWRDATRLRRLAHRLAPLAVIGLLPPLCVPEGWSDPLVAALAIGCVVLLTERLVRLCLEAGSMDPAPVAKSPRPPRLPLPASRALASLLPLVRRWGPVCVVVAAAAAYAIYMSVFTLRLHGRFGTYGYDLGQMDNVFWSTLHGRPLHDEPLALVDDWSEIRNHADWSAFFFLPFYALRPGGPVLLVIQSCVLGLGAIPLYRFASRHLSRSVACVLALAYLLYPPMHGMQFYDFHFQPIASTFVLFVIDFVDEKRYVPCALAFVVALGCREDVSIGLAILGAFLFLSGYRRRAGAVIAAAGGAYFVLIRFVIMPKLGATAYGVWTASYIYKDLIPQGGQNISGVMTTLASNPAYVLSTLVTADKLRYALQVLLPLALLPLRRGYLAVSLIHGALLTLLTTHYGPTIDVGFQYSANFIPYIFPAAALALERYGDEPNGAARRRAALTAVVTGTLLCGVFWGAIPPRKSFHGGFDTLPMTAPTQADRKRHADLVALHAMVPPDARLAVSEHEMPHISRLHMVSLRDTADADYLLYGTGSGFFGSTNADRALASGAFEKIAERPGLVLLRKKGYQPAAPAPAP